eukprot:4956778-Pyramimonas_sp.AAC.2
MPLLRKKPHQLAEDPKGLRAQDEVFVIGFTSEVFRDYDEYLQRMSLYRQKTWTCKYTGKTGCTYEEALACEDQAMEKIKEV